MLAKPLPDSFQALPTRIVPHSTFPSSLFSSTSVPMSRVAVVSSPASTPFTFQLGAVGGGGGGGGGDGGGGGVGGGGGDGGGGRGGGGPCGARKNLGSPARFPVTLRHPLRGASS